MMQNEQGIIHACTLEGNGGGVDLEGIAISEAIKDERLAWVHLDANKPESREWLQTEISYLDNIIIDALLAEETRPRILEFGEGALMILRGMNLSADARPEDMISIRLWIDAHRIISIEKRPLHATRDIKSRLIEGKGPKSAADFVVALTSRLFERMEPVFSEFDENLDDIEECIVDAPDIQERQAITNIRKQAIVFRRYIAPQREVLVHLRASELAWLDQANKRRLQEVLDRVIRYVENLDAIRERSQIVNDELASLLTDKMNKNMYMLSVIAAIFLPLGFLTGLLGINVGGIPGSENNGAFWIFCALLIAIILLQIYIFKRKNWF